MKKLFLLPLIALALVGCGGPTKGTIITMKHEDERYYEEYDYCKYQIPVTKTRTDFDGNLEVYTDMECQGGMVTRFDDEDWLIQIEDCKVEGERGIEDSKGNSTYKKDCKRAWREVDSEIYAAAKVGMYYDGKVISNASGS